MVKQWVLADAEITIINRGNLPNISGNNISHIACDRNDTKKMMLLLKDKSFDIVYDQTSYDFQQAKSACKIFSKKAKFYVFTSSQSVYDPGEDIPELAFDASSYHFDSEVDKDSNYSEAKRQAEVAFSRFAEFPICIVRPPIVIGIRDLFKCFQVLLSGSYLIKRMRTKKQ